MTDENIAGNYIPATVSPPNDILTPGSFQPLQSFNLLVGCPIDGDWTLTITDNIGIDNGYIFEWGIVINPAVNPNSEFYDVAITNGEWISPTVVGISDFSVLCCFLIAMEFMIIPFRLQMNTVAPLIRLWMFLYFQRWCQLQVRNTIICPGQPLTLTGINSASPIIFYL